jgi:acyl carrier protein
MESATTDSIEEGVRRQIARIARIPPGFSATADIFFELGVKSASALDLLLSLEDEFGVSIPDEAFGEARTVEKLVQMIAGLREA